MENLTFTTGVFIGVAVGFIAGVIAASYFGKHPNFAEYLLAWVISCSWIFWQLASGFGLFGVSSAPSTMFDIIAGGSVGFILGEKFFDYVANSASKIFKK